MYLIRSIEKDIKKWIQRTDDKKPLVIFGTRQCGKTTTVNHIAKQNFKKVYYINFLEDKDRPSFQAFIREPKFDILISYLEKKYEETIVLDNDTVIIVDELQQVMDFYTELKFVNENQTFKNIICTGSYLSMEIFANKVSVPVGQIWSLNMYTLSFEEFLMNVSPFNYEKLVKSFTTKQINQIDHETFTELFQHYLVVGGFPEAVVSFINNKNSFQSASEVNKVILDKYSKDIEKYLDPQSVTKAKKVFENAIRFMGKENNTFTLSTIKTDARYRDYEYVIYLLVNSFVCYKVDNCKNLQFPLCTSDSSSKFKIYVCDIGLVSAFYNLDNSNIETQGFNNIKGNMIEGYIISELQRNNIQPYYHRFYEGKNSYELDCVYQDSDLITKVVEIKSGKNKSSQSLNKVKDNKNINIKLTSIDNKLDDYNTPLYMFGYMISHKDN